VTRDPEASEPFSEDELLRVLEACGRDPSTWILPSARFLAYGGAHILVLAGGWRREKRCPPGHAPHTAGCFEQWYQPPIRSGAVRGKYIYWERPKNSKKIGMMRSRHLDDWFPHWLDGPRPTSSRRYQQVFDRVGGAIGLQVNPMRFRHYCAVRMKLAGISSRAIALMLGVSLQTLAIYIEDPRWLTTQKFDAAGL
jgi:hypothetical protein